MIFYDFEIYKYDWMIGYLDTETRSYGSIINDKSEFEKFYSKYKDTIWVGFNSRNYDVWIAKSILCDFNPYEMSEWLIVKERKGFEFSRLLSKFKILNYDTAPPFRSLKELEAFQGFAIEETPIPFNIDRKLTDAELQEILKYCLYDVENTFKLFIETKDEFESHLGLIKEYCLPLENINKTKAQISATILGAVKKERNDEFDIIYPDTLDMGKYEHILHRYKDWAENEKNYDTMQFTTNVCGVPHTFGIGGLHGSRDNYMGDGYYLMADVASYYPALMIEYGFLSRNVADPKKYTQIRDERLEMKKRKDPRQQPRKIVLNSTFGAQKDPYNNLYDPLQANNICIAGQLLLVDLLDKLEGKCELIQSNTDGILIKLLTPSDKSAIIAICNEWSKRTRMELEFEEVRKVIQRDVNNYIIVNAEGKVKRKGSVVKNLSVLDNDLPVVNRAVVDYFVNNIPVEATINSTDKLIDFQKITKISGKYDYIIHNGTVKYEKVNRVFASLDPKDGTVMKKHKSKETHDKTASTPINAFIDNGNILDKPIPAKLDKQWYIDLAKRRIKEFV